MKNDYNNVSKNGMPRFILWHVPHDGTIFPSELLLSVCIPQEQFEAYHKKMRDTGVSKLIPEVFFSQSAVERFEISRLLCDVERFIGNEEIMERYGMGFCYGKAYDGTVIKKISESLKRKTLRYYAEHHKRVNEKCESHSPIILFDMHSYSDDIVPKDFLNPAQPTPDVCIGADPRYTPPDLFQIVNSRFEEAGFSTAENYPYSGCYIPTSAMDGKCDCISIMLEFNKRIYLDGKGQIDEKKAAGIRGIMGEIVADCIVSGSGDGIT